MKISKYLIYCLPAALVTGPLMPEVIIIFVSLNFLYISFKKNLVSFFKNNFSKFFFLFFFIINLSSLFSDDIIYSLKTSLPYCRFYFFIIAFSYLIKEEKFFLKNIYFNLIFVLILVSMSGYIEYFFNFSFSSDLSFVKEKHRLSGFFGSELIIGSYVSRLLPLLVVLHVFLNKEGNSYFNLILIFCFFIVFLSGERTALFLASITYVSYLIFSSQSFQKKLILGLLTSFLAIYFVSTNEIVKHRLYGEVKIQILGQNKDKTYLFSKEHSSHYNTAFRMFIDSPLLGHGPRTFRIVCAKPEYYKNKHSCSTHPHNFLLQLLSEIGIFGFSFILFFFYCFFNYLKNIYNKNYSNCIFYIPFLVFFFPFVPSGNFFNNWLSIISFLSMSFSIYLLFIKNQTLKK